MSQQKLLGIVVVVLIAIFGYRIYHNWGLITVHATAEPVSKVIAEIQKQGHITLKTDLDPATPITMNVDKVPLTAALNALAESADSGWHLVYVVAPDASMVRVGLIAIEKADLQGSWKFVSHFGRNPFASNDSAPLDPRKDVWNVSAPKEATFAGYAEEASWMTNATFYYPTNWNPPVNSAPSSGVISKSASRLAKAAGGKSTAIFALLKYAPRDFARNDDPQTEAWSEDRMEEQAKRLPAAQQKVVQAAIAERKADAKLTPEERRAKWIARMGDPDRLGQMIEQMQQRFDRRSPEQKQKMYQRLANLKMQTKGPTQ